MQKINVWIDKVAFEALKNDEPKAVIVQNRLDLNIPFSKPDNNLLACELITFATLQIPEPLTDKRLVLDIENTTNFNDKDLQKIDEAKRIFNIVVNHPLYWQKIKAAWHKVTETKGHNFVSFKNYFLSGDCNFSQKDGERDLELVMYHKKWSRVVGYVYANRDNIVYINRKYFSSPLGIASNLNHEGLHLMGFSHYGNKSTSIPYLIGNKIFEDTWKQIVRESAS